MRNSHDARMLETLQRAADEIVAELLISRLAELQTLSTGGEGDNIPLLMTPGALFRDSAGIIAGRFLR